MYSPPAGTVGPAAVQVAGGQNFADLLRAYLSLGGVDYRPRHGPRHVVKEAVGADPEVTSSPLPLHIVIVYSADGGFDIRADASHGGKIVVPTNWLAAACITFSSKCRG